MARSATVNDIFQVELSISWARELQKTIKQLSKMGVMSALEASIPLRVNSLHWLPACLQCLSSCRFNELEQISLQDILYSLPQRIFQKKTKTFREINHLFLVEESKDLGLDFNAKIMHTSYDSYRNDLERSLPLHICEALKDSHSMTHVFRHLRASWMHANKVPIQEISEYFQHQSIEATRKYIHENILFSKS